jgi:hypothetical protein
MHIRAGPSCFVGWWPDLLERLLAAGLNRGREDTGTGVALQSPPPPTLTGTKISPFNSLWGLNQYHPRPLMEEFPAGNRGTGPCCHPYPQGYQV